MLGVLSLNCYGFSAVVRHDVLPCPQNDTAVSEEIALGDFAFSLHLHWEELRHDEASGAREARRRALQNTP